MHELLLQERVEAAGRLVEDEQLRLVHEGLHDADLLPVALGQPLDLPTEVEVEASAQPVDPRPWHPTAQVAEVREQLASGLPAVDDEVAGEVADPAAQRPGPVGARVGAEHLGAAPLVGRIRSSRMPDGGRLAGAVRAEEAVHLAALKTSRSSPDQPAVARAAVRLDQVFGVDGQVSHRPPSFVRYSLLKRSTSSGHLALDERVEVAGDPQPLRARRVGATDRGEAVVHEPAGDAVALGEGRVEERVGRHLPERAAPAGHRDPAGEAHPVEIADAGAHRALGELERLRDLGGGLRRRVAHEQPAEHLGVRRRHAQTTEDGGRLLGEPAVGGRCASVTDPPKFRTF